MVERQQATVRPLEEPFAVNPNEAVPLGASVEFHDSGVTVTVEQAALELTLPAWSAVYLH